MYKFLFPASEDVPRESEITKSSSWLQHECPLMRAPYSLEKFLDLFSILDKEEKPKTGPKLSLLKSKSTQSNVDFQFNERPTQALINFIRVGSGHFEDQMLYVSSQLSSYLDEVNLIDSFKKNTRSMPMKCESLKSLNLNFPLVPDNHDYGLIFELIPVERIIDVFYGIMLEERILLVTKNISKMTKAIEGLFELVFPFSPLNYRVISNLPGDMHFFLNLPCPFVICCTDVVFLEIQKI